MVLLALNKKMLSGYQDKKIDIAVSYKWKIISGNWLQCFQTDNRFRGSLKINFGSKYVRALISCKKSRSIACAYDLMLTVEAQDVRNLVLIRQINPLTLLHNRRISSGEIRHCDT